LNPITLEQIRLATGARLSSGNPSTLIQSISTDTRQLTRESLFIAIQGENHDGHHHIQTAAASGAIAAMVSDECLAHLPLLKVHHTRKSMGKLAGYVRRQLRGKVIAVAGSNGKTGTKHLIDSVLRQSLSGTISPKSFNNDIGVPTTIFAADPAHDYLVLEIGTNHPGEILNLTHIAQPDVAVITNIGAEHLEFLGDLQGVTAENAQIISGLRPDGLLIINGDSPYLSAAVASYPGRIITFGTGPQNELRATEISCDTEGVNFQLDDRKYSIPLIGRHTAVNALAAIAVARYMGVPEANIAQGLATATGPEMRLELQAAGSIRILNDAYNANPHSMQAALETLRDMKAPGRKIAILGDMRELGVTADRYHREIGQFARACNFDLLVCVGEKAGLIAEAAAGGSATISHFASAIDCSHHIAQIVQAEDMVLLKASRTMKLELIGKAIISMNAANAVQREVSSRMNKVLQQPVKSESLISS
jgi:UDP-N-acetylmuramoyl-tripeptide--D-alanyl-D-alanine ligase